MNDNFFLNHQMAVLLRWMPAKSTVLCKIKYFKYKILVWVLAHTVQLCTFKTAQNPQLRLGEGSAELVRGLVVKGVETKTILFYSVIRMIFTARRYACAVFAVVRYPSVRPSVCPSVRSCRIGHRACVCVCVCACCCEGLLMRHSSQTCRLLTRTATTTTEMCSTVRTCFTGARRRAFTASSWYAWQQLNNKQHWRWSQG